MKTILITGGAGFIGSNFVHYMLKKYTDYRIIVLDALTYAGNLDNLDDVMKHPNFLFWNGDIRDAYTVDNIMRNCDWVVNFAAETHVDRSIHEAGDFISTDIQGVFTLLEAAKKYNIEKFLQISTDEVYGSIDEGSFKETDMLNPSNPYSASKAGGEMLIMSYYRTYKTPVLITRSSNNFGPYQYPEKLIPLFITNLLENISVPVYGDGLNVRDWLYVEDNCSALDIILHKGEFGEIYNIGGDCEKTNIELTKTLIKSCDKTEDLIKYVADRLGHDRRYSISSEKVLALGWERKWDFEKGLAETVNWYRTNQDWWMKLKQKQESYKEWYRKNYEERGN